MRRWRSGDPPASYQQGSGRRAARRRTAADPARRSLRLSGSPDNRLMASSKSARRKRRNLAGMNDNRHNDKYKPARKPIRRLPGQSTLRRRRNCVIHRPAQPHRGLPGPAQCAEIWTGRGVNRRAVHARRREVAADRHHQAGRRKIRSFANLYLVPDAGVIELRHTDGDAPALLAGSTIHLPAAAAAAPITRVIVMAA